MIRQAVPSDLAVVKALTTACANAMTAKGIHQWSEKYPTQERLLQDITAQELYVLVIADQIRGMIVRTATMSDAYAAVQWATPTNRNLYIHRLAVHPTYWGQGYAQQLMDWAEAYAIAEGYQSIRLDTFSQNTRNHHFYETRGYQRLEDIYYPHKSTAPFHCYELVC